MPHKTAMPHTPLILLVHGWGLGPGVWRSVIRTLPAGSCHALDLGFFGPPRQQIPEDRPLLAVGHSLGFLWLLQQMAQAPPWRKNCLGLVSISGFSRFTRAPLFPEGIAPRLLQRMIHRLPQDPEGVLAAFRQQGGWPGNPSIQRPLDPAPLSRGLTWLQTWDCRATLQTWNGPLGVLAARDDAIVPAALTTACFPSSPIRWLDEGGHLLPLTHPDACATLIQTVGNPAP